MRTPNPHSGLIKRALAVVVVLAMVPMVAVPAASAQIDGTQGAGAQLATGLRSWVGLVAARGYAPELEARLPLTRRDVREVLDLPSLLTSDLITTLEQVPDDVSLEDLVTLIDGAGGDGAGSYGLTVTQGVGPTHGVDLVIDVVRSVEIPVSYRDVEYLDDEGNVLTLDEIAELGDDDVLAEDTVLELNGGSGSGSIDVTVSATFDASFTFTDQRVAPSPGGGLVLDALNEGSVRVAGGAEDLKLGGRVGVTEVEAAGSLSMARDWEFEAVDPDGVGGLSIDDWQVSLPATVLPISSIDTQGPAVDLSLGLSAAQTRGEADGTVTWQVDDVTDADADPAPTVELGDELAAFRNVTPSDLLNGFTKFAALVATAESRSDVGVPFTDTSVAEIVGARDAVLGAVQQQGAALVLCGRTDSSPPLGAELAGSAWYCQAYTQGDAASGSIEWSVADEGATIADNSVAGSLGVEPTTNVVITGVDSLPRVTVRWTDSETDTELAANRRFETFDELAVALSADLKATPGVADATVSTGDLVTTTDPYSVPLSVEVTFDGRNETAAFDVANGLASAGFRGIEPIDAAVDVTVDGVVLTAELAVSLEPRSSDPTDRPDRFRIVSTDEALLAVGDVASKLTSDSVLLWGRVGYLPATGTATGFASSPSVEGVPAVEVRVPSPGGEGGSVSLAAALKDPVGTLVATHAISMSPGTVTVAASSADGNDLFPTESAPTATVNWAQVSPTTVPDVQPDDVWVNRVLPFDVTPDVVGLASAADPTGVELTDSDADFLTAFGAGIEAGDEIVAQLFNLSTQASCSRFVVTSATKLTCTGGDGDAEEPGLEGGSARIDPVTGEPVDPPDEGVDEITEVGGDWQIGDQYAVAGDVTALGGIVTEGLTDVVKRLAQLTDEGLTDTLPLVNTTPRQLLPQLDELEGRLTAAIPRIAEDGSTDPESSPLDDLHDLEAALELDGEVAVDFSVRDIAPAAGGIEVAHLVATLEATRSGSLSGGDAPTLQTAIAPDVADETGSDVVFGTDAIVDGGDPTVTPQLDWSSTVVLSIGVPIDPGSDPGRLLVLDETGVRNLTVTIDSESIDLTGRLGSLAVIAGTSAVQRGTVEAIIGTHTGGDVITGVTIAAVADDGNDPPTSATTFETSADLTDVVEGDVVVTTGGGWCAIDSVGPTAADADMTEVTCGADLTDGARFAAGDTVVVRQARQVTTEDVIPDLVATDSTLVHVPSGATCTVTATDDTNITCADPLAGAAPGSVPAWSDGDGWSVSPASTSVLYVPDAEFDTLGLRVGSDTVRQLAADDTVAADCIIGEVTSDTITCETELSEGKAWTAGSRWEIGGVGNAGLSVVYTLGATGDAPLDVPEGAGGGYFDVISGSFADGAESASCGANVGRACVRLALAADAPDGAFLGFLEATAVEDGEANTSLAPAARDAVAAGEIDLSLLGTPLPFLAPIIEDALDGLEGDEDELLPLVGADLSAGAPVVEAVDAVGTALLGLDPTGIETLPGDLGAALGEATASLPSGVTVSDQFVTCDGVACTDDADPDEVEIGFVLSENLDDPTAAPGYGCGTGCGGASDQTVAFDSGLPSLLIEANASEPVNLDADRGWRLPIVIGVNTSVGPYLDVSGTDDIVLAAAVTIPEVAEAELGDRCANSPGSIRPSKELFGTPDSDTSNTDAADYDTPGVAGRDSNLRCFDATIGLLEGTFYDGATALGPITDLREAKEAEGKLTEASRLDLLTTIDLAGPTGDMLSILDLIERDEVVTRDVDARGNVDVYVVTGRTTSQRGTLPAVHASLHWAFDAGDDGSNTDSLAGDVQYLDIVVDLKSFIDDLVGPWATEALSYLSTLRPVADLLLTPIPGLSDIAEAIGNPPVTLFALAQEASGQELTLVYALLEFLLFADQVTSGLSSSVNPDDGFLGLNGANPEPNCDVAGTADDENNDSDSPCGLSTEGGFKLAQEKGRESGPCGSAVVKGKQTKVSQDCTKRGKTHNIGIANLGTTSKREEITQIKPCAASGCTGKETTRTMSRQLGVNFGTPGLAFPFLTDPAEMYGMLLGESEAELIRLDLGTLAVDFGLQYDWGPFMAGPVPIEIGVGGGLALEMRAMLGIDTLGLRTTGVLGDGFFINDVDPLSFDLQGEPRDVPELTLTFTVSVSAAISLAVIKAGVRGTLQFILGADLNDPNGDGRIRPAELAQFNGRPECALILTGDLRVIISIFVELDFKIWSKEWAYDLFRRTWRLFELKCEPEAPALAEIVGDDVVLLAGSQAQRDKRNIEEDQTNETFTVRVAEPAVPGVARTVTVEAFGIVLDYELPAGGKIVADMGDGDDNLVLGVGADAAGDPVAFDIDSDIELGSGNDSFEGGAGVDTVSGGDGSDNLSGGAGDDVLSGNGGSDNVDGGRGDDTITGGEGDDRLTGSQGSDVIDGGNGDDRLQGGPGMSRSQAERIAGLQRSARNLAEPAVGEPDPFVESLADGADVLIGGGGADELSGHFGADRIIGSAVDTLVTPSTSFDDLCSAATGTDGDDIIDGGPGDDVLAGGAGNDQITGLRGDDSLCGGQGDDHLRGDGQNVAGTDGDDVLRGDDGDDIVDGGGGHDDGDGGAGADMITGGDGDDRLSGGDGTDLIDGGTGDDEIDGDERPGQSNTPNTPEDGSIAVCEVATTIRNGLVALPGTYAGLVQVRVAGFGYVTGADAGLDLDSSGTVDALDSGVVGDVVIIGGGFDVNGDGVLSDSDDGLVPVPVLVGSGDADCLRGGSGDDIARGGSGADVIFGDAGTDTLEGGEGDDVVRGGDGTDTVSGDAGNDRLFGDAGPDFVHGGVGDDEVHGGGGPDTLTGGPGTDELYGEGGNDLVIGGSSNAPDGTADAGDELFGGPGDDTLVGDNATGDGRVADLVTGTPSIEAGGDDFLVGGDGDDALLGGIGNDTLRGDDSGIGNDQGDSPGNDVLEGNSGDDRLIGGDGNDVLIGGTTDRAVIGKADGLADGKDQLEGNSGNDTLIGDNGRRDGTVLDIPLGSTPAISTAGGGDTLSGGTGNDVVLGGLADDNLDGGPGDDVIEGNHGDDIIDGGTGSDVILGGTSDQAADGGDAQGLADGADEIDAGSGDDIVVGDNGRRDGTVLDIPVAADTGSVESVGGGDTIDGGAGKDVLLGGVGDDLISGDDPGGDQADDVIEGNHGDDIIDGGGGDDVIVGGTSDEAVDGDADGLADGADLIDAGSGDDIVVGDNGRRDGTVLDLPLGGESATPDTGGGDTIMGGPGIDTIRAGVGDDKVWAGADDDLVEGNTGKDQLVGDGGDDVIIGGTDEANHTDGSDRIAGGIGRDVLLGDNAVVSDEGVVTLHDVLVASAGNAVDGLGGDDIIDGGAGTDHILGQRGDDVIVGGAGDDVIEGNHGDDVIAGGSGDDDILGGGSADDGVIDDERAGDGLLDGIDTIHADGTNELTEGTVDDFIASWKAGLPTDGADVMAGDNARIDRDGTTRAGDGTMSRDVVLFDVENEVFTPDEGTSAGDRLYGGGGNDRIYGQGGNEIEILGGAGDDTIEGNHGDDVILGGLGDDDLIGGGSANNGVLDDDRDPAGLIDGRDVLVGDTDPMGGTGDDDGDDTISGDNAWIYRSVAADGGWVEIDVTNADMATVVRRTVLMNDQGPGESSGSDVLVGNGGFDDLYGQFDDGPDFPLPDTTCEGRTITEASGDLLCGGDGDDGLLGDQGTMTLQIAGDVGTEAQIATAGRFAEDTVFETGTLIRQVELTQVDVGGDDVLLGGSGRDVLHAGAGADLGDGGEGDDVLFGHDGSDPLWGGIGTDRLYGGFGDDFLDVKPRRDIDGIDNDPASWFEVAPLVDRDGNRDTTNGFDLIYGGEDADAMQADEATNGPGAGDRLIDWFGAFNINYVCAATNGAAVYSRGPAPETTSFLQTLAAADGLVDVDVAGSAGHRSLALVEDGNKNPRHPDTPGNFTCEGP